MEALKARLAPLIAFIQRYPRALALFSFASGVASFLLVNRQNRSAGIIAAILLVSWLWLILENLLTDKFAKRFGLEISPTVLRYVTQLIHQESLFFVLPFFFITTTWLSGQLLFTGVLCVAALVSIVDPVYYRWLAERRLVYMSFHTLALFAVMLTALPVIFQQTTDETYLYAMGAAIVLAIPTLVKLVPEGRKWLGFLRLFGMILLLTGTLWFARYWVPPATVWLTNVHVSTQLDTDNRKPGAGLKTISARQLHAEGLYAYTAIRAPRGLSERVYHVWVHEGREVQRIPLAIKGGRQEGYRTWTHKTRFPAEVVGDWQVQVVTEGGQMIGVVRFEVTPT